MCHTDHSLFVHRDNHSVTLLLVYVDDILITSNDPLFITNLSLHQQFDMKNLGAVKHFLGLEIRTNLGSF